jgi:predicted nucleic acid-binding protein
MIVVSDTSVLSNLYQIGLLYLLPEFFGDTYIPPAVARELNAIPEQKVAFKAAKWLKVEAPEVPPQSLTALLEVIDVGEAEAILLAEEKKATFLLMDEIAGRASAKMRNLKVIGILGLLARAKNEAKITHVKPHILALQKVGFRLNAKLIQHILRQVGEEE